MRHLGKLYKAVGESQFSLGRKAEVSRSRISEAVIGRGSLTRPERKRILKVLVAGMARLTQELNELLEADGADELL